MSSIENKSRPLGNNSCSVHQNLGQTFQVAWDEKHVGDSRNQAENIVFLEASTECTQKKWDGMTTRINLKSRRQIVKDFNIMLNNKLHVEGNRQSLKGFNRKRHIEMYDLESLLYLQRRQWDRDRDLVKENSKKDN